MTDAPQPVFSEPWHAEVFALTVHLNETGHFNWSDWAAAFGATLNRHGLSKSLDGGDDYFTAWLETLENFLDKSQIADPQEAAHIKAQWEAAYLSTPHGKPVTLAD